MEFGDDQIVRLACCLSFTIYPITQRGVSDYVCKREGGRWEQCGGAVKDFSPSCSAIPSLSVRISCGGIQPSSFVVEATGHSNKAAMNSLYIRESVRLTFSLMRWSSFL